MALKINVIPNWRRAHHFLSVQLNAAGVALMGLVEYAKDAWGQIPQDLKGLVPYASKIALVLFLAGIVGRYINQTKETEDGN